jgi:hypothetical protein
MLPWQYRPWRNCCAGSSNVSSDPPSCRRRPEDSISCTNEVLRASVRASQPHAGVPSRPWPRSPTSDHSLQVRGVSHDTRAQAESGARSSARDTSTGSGSTPAHRNSLVNAAASRFHFDPPTRTGFCGARHRQTR